MPELLITLGKNIGIGSKPEDIRHDADHLSDESRMTVRAATVLTQENPNLDVLFSSGHTAGPEIPSEAAAMRDYFLRQRPKFPHSQLHIEGKSLDTRTNAIEIAKLLPTLPKYDRIGLLSVSFHVLNAVKLFQRLGVKVDTAIASDEVLSRHSKEEAMYIHDWLDSPRIQKELQKERIRSLLLATLDRRGRLLHTVTKLSRH